MGVSNKSKRRGTILNEIMRYHREQLPKIMRDVPLADLRALASVAPPTVSFAATLSGSGVSLIAECKKASPSKGLLVKDYDPIRLAQAYVSAGAKAISVLTDARHFQGSLEHLRDVKEFVSSSPAESSNRNDEAAQGKVAVLRKDFIFHSYQIYESRAAGADAILLIAAVLSGNEMAELLELTRELQMEALIEVHTAQELERVLQMGPRVIGINNRNLQTFEVDFENTSRLLSEIPAGIVTVAESGVRSPDDIRELKRMGVDAVLIGESLVRSRNTEQATAELVRAGQIS
jgi:indole-3-glycerol phosphate synthase